MSDINDLKVIFYQALAAAPYLIVTALGFVFALVKYKDCPRACLLAAMGTLALFVLRIANIFTYSIVMPRVIAHGSMSHSDISQIYTILGIAWSLITSAALACVIAAVFIGRGKAARN